VPVNQMVTLRLLRRLDINNTIGLSVYAHYYTNEVIEHSIKTRGQSNLTKSASRGAHSPVRGHPRGSKFVPLNSWGRGSY